MAITLDTTSELTSVDSSSSVAGNLVTLVTREQSVENESPTSWPICVKLTGVDGITPTIRVNTTQPYFSGYIWAANERGYWSPDSGGTPNGTWTTGAAASAGTGYYDLTPPSALSGNVWWFSRSRRYGNAQVQAWIDALVSTYGSGMVKKLSGQSTYDFDTFSSQTNELGGTVAAQAYKGFRIVDDSQPSTGRTTGCIISGTHAGEDLGMSNMMATVEWWCGASSEATALRRRFNLIVLPLVNPPGKAGGHCRAQFELGAGNINDLNRHMALSPSPFQTVGKLRSALTTNVVNSGDCPFFFDFHSGYSTVGPYTWGGYGSQDGIAPLNDPFMSYWNARSGAANFGDLLVSDTQFTDAWSAHNLGAQLAETLEFNQSDYSYQTDAQIVTNGANIGLSIYDLANNGYFGPLISSPLRITPWQRRFV